MRPITIATVALALCANQISAQTPNQTTADERATQQTITDLYSAAKERDANRYRALCTDDFVLVEGEQISDVDRSIASFMRMQERTLDSRVAFRSTRITVNAALLVYELTVELDTNGTIEERRWIESATLVKSGTQWKVSAIHSTPFGSASRQMPPAWTVSLPVAPGDSLKNIVDDGRDKQVVTFFELDQVRNVNGTVFISGSGYVEIKGGGTYFSGMNRSQDPFLELTVTKPDSPAFQQCRALLVRENLVQNAIAIGGEGYFTSMPGVKGRNLGVIRLDTISTCEIKPRR